MAGVTIPDGNNSFYDTLSLVNVRHVVLGNELARKNT
jgi:hypothetical protein